MREINPDLLKFLSDDDRQQYLLPSLVPGYGICAIHRFVFTVGIVYGLNAYGINGRFCFHSMSEAIDSYMQWPGDADPPGNWIKRSTCDVMISTYESKLYNDYLIEPGNDNARRWHKHSFVSQTRQGQAIETIYFNYPPPVILHDFRYLGKDYRERERIKRKVKRFKERMQTLPASERNAILSAAVNDYNDTLNTIISL